MYKLFWDWSPRSDLMFRFQIENLTTKQRRRDRDLYTGTRAAGPLSFTEKRYAEQAPFLMIRTRKVF